MPRSFFQTGIRMKRTAIRSWKLRTAGAVALLFAHILPAMCQEQPPESAEPEVPEEIEEITVYGESNINILRRQFNLAQERMFELFNTLNSNDEFDIKCDYEQRLGSRRWHHVCTPKFNTRPQAHAGGQYMVTYDGEDKPSIQSPRVRRLNRELWEEMARLVNENPQLRQSYIDLAEKKNAYEAERERRRND